MAFQALGPGGRPREETEGLYRVSVLCLLVPNRFPLTVGEEQLLGYESVAECAIVYGCIAERRFGAKVQSRQRCCAVVLLGEAEADRGTERCACHLTRATDRDDLVREREHACRECIPKVDCVALAATDKQIHRPL